MEFHAAMWALFLMTLICCTSGCTALMGMMGGVPESLYQGLQISHPDLGPNLPGYLSNLGQTWPPMQILQACKMNKFYPMQSFHHQRESAPPHSVMQSATPELSILATVQISLCPSKQRGGFPLEVEEPVGELWIVLLISEPRSGLHV